MMKEFKGKGWIEVSHGTGAAKSSVCAFGDVRVTDGVQEGKPIWIPEPAVLACRQLRWAPTRMGLG